MRFPVNTINIKQKFGSHKGIDFGWHSSVGKNQPILAADAGVVIYNRHQVTGGYVIWIKHNDGYCTEYGHLLKNSQRVHEGDVVKKGQHIADMGSSGICTGTHLHFGVYKGSTIDYKDKSKFVDPLKYLCMYDEQRVVEDRSIVHAKDLYHTKKVTAKDGLNIRTGPSPTDKKVKTAPYNSQVECFGLKNKWNIVDNIRDYYCSNNYLK